MELAATIQCLDEKVTELEQLGVVGTEGSVERIDTSTSGREIQASNSLESRGCASAVTNPFAMKGRQAILPNKSYDSQASNFKFHILGYGYENGDGYLPRYEENSRNSQSRIHCSAFCTWLQNSNRNKCVAKYNQ